MHSHEVTAGGSQTKVTSIVFVDWQGMVHHMFI
jgi:hypothetical protein